MPPAFALNLSIIWPAEKTSSGSIEKNWQLLPTLKSCLIKFMEEFEAHTPGIEPVNKSEVYRSAFYDYFGGIMLDDIAAVNNAAQQLEGLGTPFTDELPRRAYMHECFHLEGATDSNTLEIVSGWSLRAYAYSGVPVDGELALMVASKAGYSKQSLRGWLLPCSTLIDGVIYGYDKEGLNELDKDILKWRGLKALQGIGIDRFTDKVRLAALNRRLAQVL